jgi:hypothetical protein
MAARNLFDGSSSEGGLQIISALQLLHCNTRVRLCSLSWTRTSRIVLPQIWHFGR